MVILVYICEAIDLRFVMHVNTNTESVPLGYFERYLKKNVIYWSYEAYIIFGREPTNELITVETLFSFVHPDDQEELKKAHEQILNEQRPFHFSSRIILPDGRVRVIRRQGDFLTDQNGVVNRLYGSLKDVTDEAELGVASNHMLQQQIQILLSKQKEMTDKQENKIFEMTLFTQEQERSRIAESLHNGLGQMLYGVKLSLESLNFDSEDQNLEAWKEIKIRTSTLLTDTINESRRIAHALTPKMLDDFGLKEAVKDICQQFGEALPIAFEFLGVYSPLNKHLEIAVYRIIQELVLNIAKHSNARKASVKIQKIKKELVLTVEDNGIGFNLKKFKDGIGLKSVQNKVSLLHGTFSLDSQKNKPTIISIVLPL
jgi:two-component system NarL family sensor kinase